MPRKKAIPVVAEEPKEDQSILDFEDSPAPVQEKSGVDAAFSSLKGMLGLNETAKEEKKPSLPFTAKLNKKQQQFVEATSPTIALAFMSLSTWLWGRIGPEYGVLAPADDVAQRIVEPLLRIYARHTNFLIEMHPDMADLLISLSAIAAYVHVSMGMYQQIKKEKDLYEQGYEEDNISSINRRDATDAKNGTGNEGHRSAPVRRGSRENAETVSGHGRATGDINQLDLSVKEARQHEALSRLSQLDYQHRARKSGRFA